MIALVLNVCALVFQIIGVAPPYWAYIEFGTSKVYSGLWTQCTEVLGTTSCSDVAYSEGMNMIHVKIVFLICKY